MRRAWVGEGSSGERASWTPRRGAASRACCASWMQSVRVGERSCRKRAVQTRGTAGACTRVCLLYCLLPPLPRRSWGARSRGLCEALFTADRLSRAHPCCAPPLAAAPQELERALKGTCEAFIMAATKLTVEPLLSFITKASSSWVGWDGW